MNTQLVAQIAHSTFAAAENFTQATVREAFALQLKQAVVIEISQAGLSQCQFVFNQVFNLHQEPVVDLGQGKHLFAAHTVTECFTQVPDTVGTGYGQLAVNLRHGILRRGTEDRVKAGSADLEAAQGFVHGLLESTADGHHLAHRFHLGGQCSVRLLEFLKGKAGNLGYHVVDARLKGGRCCTTGNFVLQFIQGIANSQLGRHFGDREAGGF